jgi:hypothetical protein
MVAAMAAVRGHDVTDDRVRSAVLLTLSAGCSAAGTRTLTGPAVPAGIAATSTALPSAGATTGSVPASAGWAKTTQFLQIKGSEESGGAEYLEVRQAKQKPVGEGFETVALDESWIKVKISAQARNVPGTARAVIPAS